MSETISVSEMKEIERIADCNGLPYRKLMENAGTAAFNVMKEKWPDAKHVVIFAGKGNNGGDGFVVAQLYEKEKAEVEVVLTEGRPITDDAVFYYAGLSASTKFSEIDSYVPSGKEDLVVDAVYGTGFHGEFRKNGRNAADFMNGINAPVCALDLPSGLNADTGDVAEGVVKADITVVFHKMKNGHASKDAEKVCGEIRVVSIGIEE